MARIRSIKPEFWDSEDTATLPMAAALTYCGLWNLADDDGRGRFQASILHSKLHGLRPDGSMAKTKEALKILVDRRLIVLYEVEGFGSLFYIPSFKKHQHPNKPLDSKLPKPPKNSGSATVGLREDYLLGGEGRGRGDGGEEGGPPGPATPLRLLTQDGGVGDPPTPDTPHQEAEAVRQSANQYAAWSHPPFSKKVEAVMEMRALGLSHEYIRNGAQVNKPADVGFWDVVKVLKAANGRRPNGSAKIPGQQQKENVEAYAPKTGPTHEEREAERKAKTAAMERCDALLNQMDEDILIIWQREAEQAAIENKLPPGPIRENWIKAQLRLRIAKEKGVEGL